MPNTVNGKSWEKLHFQRSASALGRTSSNKKMRVSMINRRCLSCENKRNESSYAGDCLCKWEMKCFRSFSEFRALQKRETASAQKKIQFNDLIPKYSIIVHASCLPISYFRQCRHHSFGRRSVLITSYKTTMWNKIPNKRINETK